MTNVLEVEHTRGYEAPRIGERGRTTPLAVSINPTSDGAFSAGGLPRSYLEVQFFGAKMISPQFRCNEYSPLLAISDRQSRAWL